MLQFSDYFKDVLLQYQRNLKGVVAGLALSIKSNLRIYLTRKNCRLQSLLSLNCMRRYVYVLTKFQEESHRLDTLIHHFLGSSSLNLQVIDEHSWPWLSPFLWIYSLLYSSALETCTQHLLSPTWISLPLPSTFKYNNLFLHSFFLTFFPQLASKNGNSPLSTFVYSKEARWSRKK